MYPFATAPGFVRWTLIACPATLGGLKGIDYSRAGGGGGVDFETLDSRHALAALAILALAAIADREQARIVAWAYRDGISDLRIGERLRCSESRIRRLRNRALRDVGSKARAMGLLPEDSA